MTVNVLFFGATANSVGKREIEFSFDEKLNANQVFSRLFESLPELQNNHDKDSLHFSVNQEFANGDEIIQSGDELAVFTAVSGG